MAITQCGWEPLTRLLPRPDQPELPAIRLGGLVRGSSPGLYDALRRRPSSRFPFFSERSFPAAVPAEPAEAAHSGGAVLTYVSHADTNRVLRLTTDAERHDATGPAHMVIRLGYGPAGPPSPRRDPTVSAPGSTNPVPPCC
ncbi:hypothetical protein [Streptomyces adonidis]|uniref:hypothetical protein n=1 Tax=Streptomyces adonidis TaxID=3231367 RepID=UPI0034DB4869